MTNHMMTRTRTVENKTHTTTPGTKPGGTTLVFDTPDRLRAVMRQAWAAVQAKHDTPWTACHLNVAAADSGGGEATVEVIATEGKRLLHARVPCRRRDRGREIHVSPEVDLLRTISRWPEPGIRMNIEADGRIILTGGDGTKPGKPFGDTGRVPLETGHHFLTRIEPEAANPIARATVDNKKAADALKLIRLRRRKRNDPSDRLALIFRDGQMLARALSAGGRPTDEHTSVLADETETRSEHEIETHVPLRPLLESIQNMAASRHLTLTLCDTGYRILVEEPRYGDRVWLATELSSPTRTG